MEQKYEIIDGKLTLENLNFENNLDLSHRIDLVSLPDNLTVNGSLFLNGCTSLISLPDNLTVGGSMYLLGCTSLVSLPDNLMVKYSLFLTGCTSLKTIPDNLAVGLDLNLSNCTSLESLPNNFTVRGYLGVNGCTSLISLPDNLKCDNIYTNYILQWKGKTYAFFDGIEKEIIKHRGNVYYCSDKSYVVSDGQGNFAHGKTLKEAKEDLVYKLSTRDLAEYESLTLKSELTFAEAIQFYRSVTGACSFGTKAFVNRNKEKVKARYTVAEILKLTDGAYGYDKLKEFLKIA